MSARNRAAEKANLRRKGGGGNSGSGGSEWPLKRNCWSARSISWLRAYMTIKEEFPLFQRAEAGSGARHVSLARAGTLWAKRKGEESGRRWGQTTTPLAMLNGCCHGHFFWGLSGWKGLWWSVACSVIWPHLQKVKILKRPCDRL